MTHPFDDSRLAQLAQEGCQTAFSELVDRHQAGLLSFLSFFCRDHHLLEDVAQEAFLQAYRSLATYDPDRSFKTWLYTIARRLLAKRRDRHTASEDAMLNVAGHDQEPSALLAELEQRASLWLQIRRLVRDDEFQLLWLVYADDVSIADAAEILALSYSNCKQRLKRLRTRLREELTPPAEAAMNFAVSTPLRRVS